MSARIRGVIDAQVGAAWDVVRVSARRDRENDGFPAEFLVGGSKSMSELPVGVNGRLWATAGASGC